MSCATIKLAVSVAVAFLGIAPGAAKEVPSRAIEEKALASGRAVLDPTKGYMFLRSPVRLNYTFVRVPDQQDRADYAVSLEREYARQVKAWPGKLARWEIDFTLAKQARRAPPERPAEPRRETVSIGDIEARNVVAFGPMFAFSKAEDGNEFRYLQEVKPGTYIFYGPVMVMPNGATAGTCFCMGSVRFEVKAGVITDLGDFLFVAPDRASQRSAEFPPDLDLPAHRDASYGLPASLTQVPGAPARFEASGKLNNFFGITVSRMPPVPGVLAYRRDSVIDVASGRVVPSGSGVPLNEAVTTR